MEEAALRQGMRMNASLFRVPSPLIAAMRATRGTAHCLARASINVQEHKVRLWGP